MKYFDPPSPLPEVGLWYYDANVMACTQHIQCRYTKCSQKFTLQHWSSMIMDILKKIWCAPLFDSNLNNNMRPYFPPSPLSITFFTTTHYTPLYTRFFHNHDSGFFSHVYTNHWTIQISLLLKKIYEVHSTNDHRHK